MNPSPTRCLILACGNTLRGDDGVGPWLAAWAEEHFRDRPGLRVLSPQQWTPDLAQDIARAESVIFIDSSAASAPGELQAVVVEPVEEATGLATHHLHAAQLLALARSLYGSLPRNALLITVGAASMGFTEEFSEAVKAALPKACDLLEELVPAPEQFMVTKIRTKT